MGITATYDRERLRLILREQHDVVTRRQLLECGMSRGAIQHRVGPEGRWLVILPGVYVTTGGRARAEQREMAAMLYAGPGAVMTGAFAARRHGLTASGPDYVDVLIPVRCRRQSVRFVRLIHTARMPEKVLRSGLVRVAAPARAVADAVRGYRSIDDARSLICMAIQRGKCTLADLAEELREGPKRGSALLLRGLNDAAKGIWSAAEGQLMDLVRRSDLPEPEYNVALYAEDGTLLGIVDAWWDKAGVAAEVDSQEFHFRSDDWRATMERHNRLTKHRVQLLHFPPVQITSDGATVLSDLRDAIASGRMTPPPPVRAVPQESQRVDYAIDTL